MIEILEGLALTEMEDEPEILLPRLIGQIRSHKAICDADQLLFDIEERERKGGFVLGDLVMLHAKSAGVDRLLVAIFRMDGLVLWNGEDGGINVSTLLLMAAPDEAAKEHIDMISQISASLIEDSFVQLLKQGSKQDVSEEIEKILSEMFIAKLRGVAGG
jgi:mannitol operon transcriptional antiterminator